MKQSKNIRANEGKYDKLALFSIDEAIASKDGLGGTSLNQVRTQIDRLAQQYLV